MTSATVSTMEARERRVGDGFVVVEEVVVPAAVAAAPVAGGAAGRAGGAPVIVAEAEKWSLSL